MSTTYRVALAAAFAVAMCGSRSGAQAQAQASTAATPVVTPDTTRLVIEGYGEVRTRSEWDRPPAASPSDFFTLMRSRLGVRIAPSTSTAIVMEAQDSRVLGDASPAARQSFDLHQGFLQLSNAVGRTTLTVRAGRQEIALANERLVGAVGWSNFGRSFDGLRVSLVPAGAQVSRWTAEVFGATIEERGRRFGGSRSAPVQDHTLGGAFVSHALNAGNTARVEMTALLDVGSDYRTFRDARRSTVDLRVRHANIGGLRVELEGAAQRGSQQVLVVDTSTPQSVNAWMAGVRIGNAITTSTPLGITLGADFLSGDADASDSRYSTFNTLYGTNHPFYGLMDVFGDPAGATRERGLRDVFVQADARFNDRYRLHAELHRFELATGEGRDLGWEADVVFPIPLTPQARVDIGYSAFRAGDAAPAVGLGVKGSIKQWAYVQLRASFQR